MFPARGISESAVTILDYQLGSCICVVLLHGEGILRMSSNVALHVRFMIATTRRNRRLYTMGKFLIKYPVSVCRWDVVDVVVGGFW